jgi:hypothetical protein
MTKTERTVLWVGVIGSICSITGISILTVLQKLYAPERAAFPGVARGGSWLIAVLLVGVLSISILIFSIRKGLRRANGFVIPNNHQRSKFSQAFAAGTLRRLDIFAGDLSWLEEDFAPYLNLRRRDVRIRILTDTPAASAIALAKSQGIEFRSYPRGMTAPIKASLADVDEESESRALVIKRRAPRNGQGSYAYWVKVYRGADEFAPIRAMSVLFEEFWTNVVPV